MSARACGGVPRVASCRLRGVRAWRRCVSSVRAPSYPYTYDLAILCSRMYRERARLSTRGVGVTAEAQFVFDFIHKTLVASVGNNMRI